MKRRDDTGDLVAAIGAVLIMLLVLAVAARDCKRTSRGR